jgi:glycosyltransferase involved in cell wall biosynthesis
VSAPRVSVILPTCDRLSLLRDSVASVFAQTLTDWELRIADDGSTPETRAWLQGLAQDPRVQLTWLPKQGSPAATRNAALAGARGAYVAFLDSDDLWSPRKLATQLDALQGSACAWSYTAFTRITRDGRPLDETQHWWKARRGDIFDDLLTFDAVVPTPTVMVARSVLERIGGFDARLVQFEDYHLWLRLSLESAVLLLEQPLASVRTHDQHYFRAGLEAQQRLGRMLEVLREQHMETARRASLERAIRRNLLQRARALAARGAGHDARELLRQGAGAQPAGARDWLESAATRLYLSAPSWLRGGYQRMRGRRPA